MSEATERDREVAESLTTTWETAGTGYWDLDERIAAALADERERARAPFLRLLYQLDEPNEALAGRDQAAIAWLAEHVRAAAQEPPT